MLAIAVAEAMAQVVEDEPSKLTACTALFRRRNSNLNSNINTNVNYNAALNGLRRPHKKPMASSPWIASSPGRVPAVSNERESELEESEAGAEYEELSEERGEQHFFYKYSSPWTKWKKLGSIYAQACK